MLDFRFKDFARRCSWRNDASDCTHAENELASEDEAPCACDFCPLVEAYIAEDDSTDYSQGEQPIRLLQPTKGTA